MVVRSKGIITDKCKHQNDNKSYGKILYHLYILDIENKIYRRCRLKFLNVEDRTFLHETIEKFLKENKKLTEIE